MDMQSGLGRGNLLPAFSLAAANRERPVSLWDYKPRRNLALVFIPQARGWDELLRAIGSHWAEYAELEAEVLVVVPEAVEGMEEIARRYAFPILSDPDGDLWRRCVGGASDLSSANATALVADRWGEVYGRVLLDRAEAAAGERQIREWLELIAIQCPECFPPEWPAAG